VPGGDEVIDEDAPQPCLKCGVLVSKDGMGSPETHGAAFMASIEPETWEGVTFHPQLEITVCGGCLAEAGRSGRVLVYSIPASEPEVSRWRARGLRAL